MNYNRTKHQGKYVVFPETMETRNKTRIAYGRNGVGRHGMLCFADKYVIKTWKEGNGTEISSYASRNIPNIPKIKEILSARFIYDPELNLVINGENLTLATCDGIVREEELVTKDGKKLKIAIIDSTKTAVSSQQHGVAFWVCGRLVGSPAWSYGKYQFLDARYRIAKRYTVIVQSEDIIDEVQADWMVFFDTNVMDNVYYEVRRIVLELVNNIMKEQVADLKAEIIEESFGR